MGEVRMAAAGEAWQVQPIGADDAAGWQRWDRLLADTFGGHAMLESRFLRGCVARFGGPHLLLCSLRDGGRDRAMLLVEPRRPGLYGTFAPSQSQIAPVLVRSDDMLDLQALFARLPAACLRLDLFNVDAKFNQTRLGPVEHMDVGVHGVTTAVDARVPFDQWWGRRPKKLRDNMKRYQRRFDEEGRPLQLRVVTDAASVADTVARYGDLESRGWKGKAGTALHRDNVQGAFYADLMRDYAARGAAFAFELLAGERLVAARLAIASGRQVVMLKTAFDEEFEHLAPGRVLLYLSLKHLFEHDACDEIEFYTNAQPDQLAWADASRELCNISVYRYGTMRQAVHCLRALRPSKAPPLNYGIKCFERFEDVPKAVLKTWEQLTQASIFLAPEWFQNLYQHVGQDLGALCIVVLFNKAEEVLAILPCVTTGGGRDLQALANYYSPKFATIVNHALIDRTQAIRRMVAALLRMRQWDSISLFPMADDDELALYRAAARRHWLGQVQFAETVNWTQHIDDLANYKATRPAPLRTALQRKSRRLQRGGPHRFAVLRAVREASAAMEDFKRIYAASWKPLEPYPGFIDGLAQLAAARGALRLGLLYIGESAVAGQMWFVDQSVAYIYKLAYDDAYAQFSPGTLLTMHMIEHVAEHDGVTEVDYLTGDDAYKRDWMSTRRLQYRLRIAIPRRPRGAYLTLYNALRRAKYDYLGG